MKLLKLTVQNFMPYKGVVSLSFPTNPERNVMLVYGDNMRGKTSLLNALRWAFYGKALGRHSRELPLQDLVNKESALEGEWTMETCVVFEESGHTYEYRRRAVKRPLVSKPSRTEDFEVSRGLLKDGNAVSDYLIDNEISRFAPEQTSRFFLFDGELLQEYESLLIDGSDQGRHIKESIEQALGVPSLIKGRYDAQTLLKVAQKQQSRDLEKLNGAERLIEKQKALQAEVEAWERDVGELERRLKTTKDERTKLDEFIEATEQIYVAKERLTANQKSRDINSQSQKDYELERLSLIRDVWRDLIRPQIAQKRDHLVKENKEHTEVMIRKATIIGQIDQLKKSIESALCHACGQPLHNAHRHQAEGELRNLEGELQTIVVDENKHLRIGTDLRDLERLLKPGPSERIGWLDHEISKLKVEQTRLDNEIEKLQDQIKGQDTTDIARRRSLRDALVKEEGSLEQSIRNNRNKIEKNNKDLQMIAKSLESIPSARANKSTQRVAIATELERIYAHSIERLRDDLKTRVEKFATSAFKALTTQAKYSRLKINSNYGLSILDELGHEVTIRSAGAEQIVALSLIDGLARAGRSAGPVVMDTPFGRLDPKHRSNILRYLPSTTPQLILFIHEGEVAKHKDLTQIASRIDSIYEIVEVNARHSKIEKVMR